MKRFTPLLALLIVAGCQSLGIPSLTSFNQKLDAAYAADTAVLNTTTTLYASKSITVEDAKNIEAQADNVKAALDIARQTYATDQTTGGNKLASAITALGGLQTYLATKTGAAK